MGRARALGIATAAGAVALLAACGGGGDDADADADGGGTEESDSAAGGGAYEGELEDGSTLRVRLDVGPSDAAVTPFEAFRSGTGAPAVTWIVAEIAVPDDVEGATGRFLTFLEAGVDPLDDDPLDDGDGATNADFACSLLDDWAAATADPAAVAEAHLALLDGPCGGQTLQVLATAGETTTYVLAYEGELPEFERIFAGLATELSPLD